MFQIPYVIKILQERLKINKIYNTAAVRVMCAPLTM